MRSATQKGRIANAATRSKNREQAGDVWSDCWPDGCCGEEDPERLEAAARLNTPGSVFGEVGRVLGVVVIGIIVIDLGLNALNIQ
jgi:hypothetical protein